MKKNFIRLPDNCVDFNNEEKIDFLLNKAKNSPEISFQELIISLSQHTSKYKNLEKKYA